MNFWIKTLVVLGILAAGTAAAWKPVTDYWNQRNQPKFRTVKVERGSLSAVVNSIGTVEPVLKVKVGAFVSGPIARLYVDYNDEVQEGDSLADIDPRIYQASVERDQAGLATRVADLHRVEARLQNAMNDEQRAKGLRADNEDFISDTEMDQFRFSRQALEAELELAKAAVQQAQATLNNSLANLNYTRIESPVAGVVIERKVDPGQTVAASFQTPELFTIAPDMRKEMHIFASVDEADIGLIREAKFKGQRVSFTVDAHPGEVFSGAIYQIRMSPTTTQNVVTYPVVVTTDNSDLKLLPGMTADLSFQVEQREGVLKVPNSALRFFPKKEHVRPADHGLLDGTAEAVTDAQNAQRQSAQEIAEATLRRRKRHVWVKEGTLLKAVQIQTGINDYRFMEIVGGELTEGQEIVYGVE